MSFGHDRERAWKRRNIDEGRFAMRSPASLGEVDVISLKAGEPTYFDEVKANEGSPFKNFSPADRAELLEVAEVAGAEARLVHWPRRKQPTVIPSEEWPG